MSDVVTVGGREFKITPGQVEIARSGEWALVRSTQSICGKWQNYKLYRDVKSAPKKVFYLSVETCTGEFQNSHDAMVLQEHYHGMAEWVIRAVNGKVGVAPKFPAMNGRRRVRAEAEDLMQDERLVNGVLKVIHDYWVDTKPLSPYAQTAANGRYAAKVISKTVKASQQDIDKVVWGLLTNGRVELVIFNPRMKTKGLRVRKPMEIDNG